MDISNIKVTWGGNAQFTGESSSGHKVLMDGPVEGGGQNLGLRPMEMLLLGTAACSSYDVINILRKSRQQVTACEVLIDAERAKQPPKVFTKIHLHFNLTGNNLSAQKVARAISLSAKKYCSASIMLGATANISHDYEILPG